MAIVENRMPSCGDNKMAPSPVTRNNNAPHFDLLVSLSSAIYRERLECHPTQEIVVLFILSVAYIRQSPIMKRDYLRLDRTETLRNAIY